ncbi:uncharacterized protein EpC_34610 [Erwinia pyrifoliae Ep1/96]|nr:uncharacterized protein EpC_34610 [Erwinia pyrifoliae Ep1/96]
MRGNFPGIDTLFLLSLPAITPCQRAIFVSATGKTGYFICRSLCFDRLNLKERYLSHFSLNIAIRRAMLKKPSSRMLFFCNASLSRAAAVFLTEVYPPCQRV